MTKIKRALISVSDKTGVVEFAKGLSGAGVQILSTGGTARVLREGGVPVVDDGRLVGIVTESDFLKLLRERLGE